MTLLLCPVQIHVGITLFFHPIGSTEPLHIRLGETTAQDLTVDLGPPSRKHYKDDDRMTIHSTSSANEEDRGCQFVSPWTVSSPTD